MKRYLTLILSLFLLLTSCFRSTGEMARLNIGSNPGTLDPRKARDLNDLAISRMLFEGLTRINQEEKPEMALGEKWEVSSDGKSYLFTLRKAYWSNGQQVTAHDFVYAWKKSLSPDFPSAQAFNLYVIKNGRQVKEGLLSSEHLGVQAINELVLRIELEHPVPRFLELLSLPIFAPVMDQADERFQNWSSQVSTFINNGPFVLKKWHLGSELQLRKNSTYWDAAHVKLKAVQLITVNEETALKMFEKNQLDWVGSPLSVLPLDAVESLKKRGDLHQKPFLATQFIRINIESTPFHVASMRRAFASAIRRSEIAEHILQGGGVPATAFLPSPLKLRKEAYFEDGSISEAVGHLNEALKELHLESSSFLPPITCIYVADSKNHLVAQAIQEQCRLAFGIQIHLFPMEKRSFFDKVVKGDFQLAFGSWFADFNSEINFLEIFKFKKGGSNHTNWEDSRYQSLLDEALTASPEQRADLFSECESILMRDMPIIPLFHPNMLYLNRGRLKGVVLQSLGSMDLRWASLEE